MNPPIQEAYDALLEKWGAQHWWPAESRLEMMLGAILTQNTAWTNVEKALENLKSNQAISLPALTECTRQQLAEWIRPAGYFNQKAAYIKMMVDRIKTAFDLSLDHLFKLETSDLRNELLSWKGIGPETADSILLYAGGRPVFVVDAYTRRFLTRHEWIDERVRYDEIARLFTSNLPLNTQLFNEYHALIVQLGKTFCKTRSRCEACPLRAFLPS
ncbi:MAG: endonuclease III domain-containing protein [Pontiellaceae bacterium]|nr:endonuclease III domain-containing protein [Pontiellaceae bacterium]MBN2784606.1 endonuclease III domain-containing protein [Pontiellaceae bacterium]